MGYKERTFVAGDPVWIRRPHREPIEGVVQVAFKHVGSELIDYKVDLVGGGVDTQCWHFLFHRPMDRDLIIRDMEEDIEVEQNRLRVFTELTEPEE